MYRSLTVSTLSLGPSNRGFGHEIWRRRHKLQTLTTCLPGLNNTSNLHYYTLQVSSQKKSHGKYDWSLSKWVIGQWNEMTEISWMLWQNCDGETEGEILQVRYSRHRRVSYKQLKYVSKWIVYDEWHTNRNVIWYPYWVELVFWTTILLIGELIPSMSLV